MDSYQTIRIKKREEIGYLIFNRPNVLNSINQQMIDELLIALREIEADKDIRVLIITGAGKAFQVGADIGELRQMNPTDLLKWNEGIVRVNATLEKIRQPVIAAINGAAMGGGLELALACTLRVAARSAKMGLPEVKLGIIPGSGGTQRLPRLIGKAKAAELLLTGKIVGAEEALEMGVLNYIAEDNKTVESAEALAASILPNAPIAIEMTKDAIETGKDLPLEQAVQYSQKNCAICFSTEDMREGIAAFLEKRKPDFAGK